MTLVAAVAENGVIGQDGRLPWHLRGDLAAFRALTTGHTVVMGRRTAESLPGGRPLLGRRNLVLSRSWAGGEGFEVMPSVEAALREIWQGPLFVIGGAEVYAAFLPHATHAVITHVAAKPEGDTFMPDLGDSWRRTDAQQLVRGEENDHDAVLAHYARQDEEKPLLSAGAVLNWQRA